MIPNPKAWNRTVDALSRMRMADRLGRGRTKRAFVLTPRLYADELEKLIPKEPCPREVAAEDP